VGWELDDAPEWEEVEADCGPEYWLRKRPTVPWVPVHREECPVCGGRGFIEVIW
jgi:hypothetical protein